ncbi:hypothetical protein Goarm_011267, partial [Gossypium armourianum]|nr:hypothetical protein [Gossypium armourianum]
MSMPMPIPVPNAEHENRNLLLMHNETNTSSNATNLSSPRPIKNSLYDPLFKGIELPVDPHLRMFATMGGTNVGDDIFGKAVINLDYQNEKYSIIE